jgi:cytochrome b561
MLMNSADRYGLISRLFHWVMAFMILAMIGLGIYMTELDKGDALRSQLYSLHKSVGVTILILAVLRLIWIAISPPPPPPKALQRIEIIIAKSVIGLFYLLMLATPIVGYLMSNSAGWGVNYFGLVDLPMLMGKDHGLHEIFEEAHAILAFSFLALVALHVAGALKHRLLSKNPDADVLKRML